jgi:hemerythrin-like domain-containing protein
MSRLRRQASAGRTGAAGGLTSDDWVVILSLGQKRALPRARDMNAHHLARWLREEHEKIKEISARMLDQVALAPRTNQQRWIDDVREAFEHLRAHHVKHMALEERDGYMLPVVDRRPALAGEVDRLAHEHREIQRIMDRIHQELHDLSSEDNLLIRDACRRIQDLLSYVEHHEGDESLLLLAAFTDDIGTKD